MMALYVYKCEQEHETEISHPMSESPIIYCAECIGIMKKQFGTPWTHFKGSGFYSTDK